MKKTNKKKEQKPEEIVPFWTILPEWDRLNYEKQAEHYWKYCIKDGKRLLVTDEDYE